ncbi:MAG: chromate transporter [Anaerolineales bacterium]
MKCPNGCSFLRLYKEAVGSLMTDGEFIEAVGFSSALPGSDALQLAMFVGYAAGGIPGALLAVLGSMLPPTLLMLGVVSVLQRLRGEAWVGNFVSGLTPAVAVLMAIVAWQIFKGENGGMSWITVLLAGGSLLAFLLKVPAPLVLLASGLLGIILFR